MHFPSSTVLRRGADACCSRRSCSPARAVGRNDAGSAPYVRAATDFRGLRSRYSTHVAEPRISSLVLLGSADAQVVCLVAPALLLRHCRLHWLALSAVHCLRFRFRALMLLPQLTVAWHSRLLAHLSQVSLSRRPQSRKVTSIIQNNSGRNASPSALNPQFTGKGAVL